MKIVYLSAKSFLQSFLRPVRSSLETVNSNALKSVSITSNQSKKIGQAQDWTFRPAAALRTAKVRELRRSHQWR